MHIHEAFLLKQLGQRTVNRKTQQCDFRFDLFSSFSFSFAVFFVLVLVLPTTKEYQTCQQRRVDDLPKYRPPLVTDSTPYGRSTRKRRIVC